MGMHKYFYLVGFTIILMLSGCNKSLDVPTINIQKTQLVNNISFEERKQIIKKINTYSLSSVKNSYWIQGECFGRGTIPSHADWYIAQYHVCFTPLDDGTINFTNNTNCSIASGKKAVCSYNESLAGDFQMSVNSSAENLQKYYPIAIEKFLSFKEAYSTYATTKHSLDLYDLLIEYITIGHTMDMKEYIGKKIAIDLEAKRKINEKLDLENAKLKLQKEMELKKLEDKKNKCNSFEMILKESKLQGIEKINLFKEYNQQCGK